MATSNLNFFYNTVSDIPNRHLERVPLYVVLSNAEPLSEEYKSSKIYFASSDTNSIFKTPTGNVSFLKKLERAWIALDFASTEKTPQQLFLNAMMTDETLKDTFYDKSNLTISDRLAQIALPIDTLPEENYRIENFYYRSQGNPPSSLCGFSFVRVHILGQNLRCLLRRNPSRGRLNVHVVLSPKRGLCCCWTSRIPRPPLPQRCSNGHGAL